jgi:tRNA-(ms[2]io[6]A)-hydroxylase
LDWELQEFYLSLLKSEARHFQDYLSLAEKLTDKPIEERIEDFLERERELVLAPDEEFRFHSGPWESSSSS